LESEDEGTVMCQNTTT